MSLGKSIQTAKQKPSLFPYNIFIELYFHQQAMTVGFGYGKLHQAMFGDQLGVLVWNKRKKRLNRLNKEMSRWNPRGFLHIHFHCTIFFFFGKSSCLTRQVF